MLPVRSTAVPQGASWPCTLKQGQKALPFPSGQVVLPDLQGRAQGGPMPV